jgi:hypothetical protein
MERAKIPYQKRRIMNEREGKATRIVQKGQKIWYLEAEEASSGAQSESKGS